MMSPKQLRLLLLMTLSLLALFVAVAQVAGEPIVPPCDFGDDRINSKAHRDCGAPVAIYLRSGNIVVTTLNQGINPSSVIVTAPLGGQIPVGANQVLAQATNPQTGREVVLARLTTGEYQLNTAYADGTGYIVVWYEGANDLYHLDPATGQPLDNAKSIVVPGGGPASSQTIPLQTTTTTTTTSTTPTVSDGLPVNNCRVTIKYTVRLRSEPNTSSEIITRLPFGTTYQVTEAIPGWFRVIYSNTQGWVSADFVSTTGGCGDQPVPTPAA